MTNKQQGFTLIETMIAFAIVAGAIMAAGNSWSGNFTRVEKMRAQNRAAGLLERVMTEMKIKYQEAIPSIPETASGKFEGLNNYSWEMKSKPFEMPSLSSLIVSQDKNTDANLIQLVDQMTEYFKQAVKEMTVTVIYSKHGKQLRYEVTTYFVDYNQQIPMLAAAQAMNQQNGLGQGAGGNQIPGANPLGGAGGQGSAVLPGVPGPGGGR